MYSPDEIENFCRLSFEKNHVYFRVYILPGSKCRDILYLHLYFTNNQDGRQLATKPAVVYTIV